MIVWDVVYMINFIYESYNGGFMEALIHFRTPSFPYSFQSLWFVKNLNIKLKFKLVTDVCADTNFEAIRNGFFQVSRTDRKFNLVKFDEYLSKKYILIGSAATSIDLPTGNTIYQMNYNPLLHVDYNYLLYISQACEYGVDVHDFSKCHGEKNIYAW